MLTREYDLNTANAPHVDTIGVGVLGGRFLIHATMEFDPDSIVVNEEPPWQVDLQLDWGNGLRVKRSIINDGDPEHLVAFVSVPIALKQFQSLTLTTTPNEAEFSFKLRYWLQDLVQGSDLAIVTQQP